MELLELARLSGVPMKEEARPRTHCACCGQCALTHTRSQVFDTLLELLRLDCTPASVCSVLKNLAIKPSGRPTMSGVATAVLAAQAFAAMPKQGQ